MQARLVFTSEKERDNKEYARFLIRPASLKIKQLLKFLKAELQMQKIDSNVFTLILSIDSLYYN